MSAEMEASLPGIQRADSPAGQDSTATLAPRALHGMNCPDEEDRAHHQIRLRCTTSKSKKPLTKAVQTFSFAGEKYTACTTTRDHL